MQVNTNNVYIYICVCTVAKKIFIGDKFLWVARFTKIKHIKICLRQITRATKKCVRRSEEPGDNDMALLQYLHTCSCNQMKG